MFLFSALKFLLNLVICCIALYIATYILIITYCYIYRLVSLFLYGGSEDDEDE